MSYRASPEIVMLWPGEATGSDERDTPTLTVYPAPPAAATGAAVVVLPGGAYGMLAEYEGAPIARWLNSLGITGAVLKYRLGPRHRHPAMRDDAAQAVRILRAGAKQREIDPERIGVLGFSAGGHLASTLSAHFDDGDPSSSDPFARVSSRPDLAVLLYPVVTFTEPYAHLGSRENLLGPDPDPALVSLLSGEKHVTSRTPPTFIAATADDEAVPSENSLHYALALRAARVPVELHLYESGPHGELIFNDLMRKCWQRECALWLARHGFARKEIDEQD